jgi:hypothetical protein
MALSDAIKPVQAGVYETKQPRFPNFETPFHACYVAGSSGGKTTLLVNHLLNHLRGCFEGGIYVFSPNAGEGGDTTFQPLRDYIYGELGIPKKIQCFFDQRKDLDTHLPRILDDHAKIIKSLKEKKRKVLPGILILADDWADSGIMEQRHGVFARIFMRERHNCVSCMLSTQRFRSVALPMRLNFRALFILRLRSQKEYEAVQEELSNMIDKKTFKQLYDLATSSSYGHLYIRTKYSDIDHAVYISDQGYKRVAFSKEEE